MHQTVLDMRREHPTWGSQFILVRLAMAGCPEETLPSPRTVRRWFQQAELSAAPAGRRRRPSLERATKPHEVWQMDASEALRLKSRDQASWLRIIDECSGAVLWTRVFGSARWETIPAVETQKVLREAFRRWGMPAAFRVDNGFPWGTSTDLPTDLTLWLTGLDVKMTWNPAACPQKNGVIERSMRTGQAWAEPGKCRRWQELQKRVDEADYIQREKYPFLDGQTRLGAFPELLQKRRKYTQKWERETWSLQRVWEYMSEMSWQRKVDRAGQVSMYRQRYYIGKDRAGATIQVSLDPLTGHWIFSDAAGTQLRTAVAEELTRDRIIHLAINPARHHQRRKR